MTSCCPRALPLIASLALWFGPVLAQAEENIESIKTVCAGCHGKGGVSLNPMVPTLAGQPYTLIEDNLLAFRAGKRACAPERNDRSPAAQLAQTMCQTVAELSDAQIAALASYFESQPFEPAGQRYDAALAERGSELHVDQGCERCHSDGGRTTNAMAPILAGQWTPYLRREMEALRAGTKKGPKVMNTAIHDLGDEEVEALLNYYASRQGGGAADWQP